MLIATFVGDPIDFLFQVYHTVTLCVFSVWLCLSETVVLG